MSNTKLHSKVYRGDTSIFTTRSKQFGIGSTTTAARRNERVGIMAGEKRWLSEPPPKPANAPYCKAILELAAPRTLRTHANPLNSPVAPFATFSEMLAVQ